MFAYFLPLVILLLTQVDAQITLCAGTWSDWTPVTGEICVDPLGDSPCGMCGQIQVKRTCTPSICSCQDAENTTMTGACGEIVCIYPRQSCCAPYKKKVVPGGGVICALP